VFNKKKLSNNTALFLKVHAVDSDRVISSALNMVPDISRKTRAIGWNLVIEEMQGMDFFENLLACGQSMTVDEGRRMLIEFANLLDANVDYIEGMDECYLQACIVDEQMDKPVPELSIHWSRHRAASSNVVPLFGPRPWRPGMQAI